MLYSAQFRLGIRNQGLNAGIFFGRIRKAMKLQSSEKEFYNSKSYQEAAITSLPEMIVPAWPDVHILSVLHSSAQMFPLSPNLS